MVEHDDGDLVVRLERRKRVEDRPAHAGRQRMDRPGPVEADATDAALPLDENVTTHCRVSSRPMIMRMTWFVPSRIECTRRSRQKRSIG
jgi:hypothetical protein